MPKITELIIDGCIHFGLKKEEAKTVLQILLTEEQKSDMVYWILRNLNTKMEPIDVIMAAGDIQWKYKQLSNMKEVNIPFNRLAECSPSVAKVTTDHYGNQITQRILSREEVCDLMKMDCTDLAITDTELKIFQSEFTYLFQGYTVFADSDRPLTDCIEQLVQLKAPSNDHFLVKIWTSPGHKISAEQLREFRRWFTRLPDCSHSDCYNALLSLQIGIGEDNSLKDGEVRIDVMQYYNEMCWPPRFWFAWISYCKENSLEEILNYQNVVRRLVVEEIEEKYREEAYESTIDCGILNMKYFEGRSWDETLKVLEYLATQTKAYKLMAHEYARSIPYCDEMEEFLFKCKLLKWCIGKGGILNVFNEGDTILDILYELHDSPPRYYGDWFTDTQKSHKEHIQNLIDFARSYGAKTTEEVYAEEDKVEPDYEQEINLIKEYCSTYQYY